MFSIEHCKHRVKCNKKSPKYPFLNTSIQNPEYVINTSKTNKRLIIRENTILSSNTSLHVIDYRLNNSKVNLQPISLNFQLAKLPKTPKSKILVPMP
mgnify:CR=1 FL=1